MKRAKKCIMCDKLLRIHNKSGLCAYHYSERLRARKIKRLLGDKLIQMIDELIIDYEIDKVFGDIK